jgi:hypothetical protein
MSLPFRSCHWFLNCWDHWILPASETEMASALPLFNINPTHGTLYSYSPLAPRRLNSQVQQGLVIKNSVLVQSGVWKHLLLWPTTLDKFARGDALLIDEKKLW